MTKVLTNTEELFNLKYLKSLFLLANITGQLHPDNINKPYKAVKWYKIYAGCIILLTITGYILTQMQQSKTGIFTNTTASVMHFMTITIFTISTIYAVVENVFLSPSKLHAIFQKFIKIDEYFAQIHNSTIVEHKYYILKLILQHVIIFSIIIFNIIWFELLEGNRIIKISYLQIYAQYHTFVTFLLITNCFAELRNRFRSTNSTLTGIFGGDLNGSFNMSMKISKNIEILTMIYGILTEITDLFNDLFGWQILAIFIYTLIGLLTSLNFIALFVPRCEEIVSDYDINTGFFIVVVLDFTIFAIVSIFAFPCLFSYCFYSFFSC